MIEPHCDIYVGDPLDGWRTMRYIGSKRHDETCELLNAEMHIVVLGPHRDECLERHRFPFQTALMKTAYFNPFNAQPWRLLWWIDDQLHRQGIHVRQLCDLLDRKLLVG